ncbi:hypothetical protein SHI21_19635 [Bacteriovorax sp. PP10]|uniref:Uncharacterized protein n=1 Tax=Bacteriovorax antarcticus TaxID=3088717 RepID=A0ABU5VZF9_9BACT|nr:hypothetical protein [Bacteriovorax sp. PP10]MEA9358458.1 hypothetical protein [Bacteriovorax sp. PP10]
MEDIQFAKLANKQEGTNACAVRSKLIKEALEFLVREFNIEFGDFRVFVRQGQASERIEINKSLKFNLKTH